MGTATHFDNATICKHFWIFKKITNILDEIFVNFWGLSGANVCNTCRPQKCWNMRTLFANIGLDTAENDSSEVSWNEGILNDRLRMHQSSPHGKPVKSLPILSATTSAKLRNCYCSIFNHIFISFAQNYGRDRSATSAAQRIDIGMIGFTSLYNLESFNIRKSDQLCWDNNMRSWKEELRGGYLSTSPSVFDPSGCTKIHKSNRSFLPNS